MKFFLSAEVQSGGASTLMQFHRITQTHLNTLETIDYGPELTDISIITIMVRKELSADNGYPERRLYQRKSRCADIRLRLDFEQFLCATPQQRYELYCRHILYSIETLRKKVSSAFRFDDLIRDVQSILEHDALRTELLQIKRFP